jgi:type 1 fimbria pilin
MSADQKVRNMSHDLSRLLLKALLIAVACTSTYAFAGSAADCTGALPLTVNLPAVSVPAKLAVGQPIPGASAAFGVPVNCTVNPGADWYITTNPAASITLVPGYSDVYTTSGMGAGVGFRMRNAAGAVMTPVNYQGTVSTYDMGPSQNGSNVLQGRFELVKTGTATVGSFGFSSWAHVPNQEWANGTGATSTINFKYTILNNSVPSCSVTTPDIVVTLPTVSSSAFQGVGATAGTTMLNLGLQCDANAKPAISITDSAAPSNQTNALTLASGSSATGLGVQILYQMTPMFFGPATYSYTTSSTSNTSNVSLGTLSGTQNVVFQARYIRTAASVTAGTVRALATFTMNYN